MGLMPRFRTKLVYIGMMKPLRQGTIIQDGQNQPIQPMPCKPVEVTAYLYAVIGVMLGVWMEPMQPKMPLP